MKRVAFIMKRQRIWEMMWSDELWKRQEDAFADFLLYGRATLPDASLGKDVMLRPYRPKLP